MLFLVTFGCGGPTGAEAGSPPAVSPSEPTSDPGDDNSCSPASDAGHADWEDVGDIVYLLPEDLPDGWTLRSATERVGLPRAEWTSHTELLAGARGEDGLLIVEAHRLAPHDDPRAYLPLEEGMIGRTRTDGFIYFLGFFFAYADHGPAAEDADGDPPARATWRRANGLTVFVIHLASDPDDALIGTVADEMERIESLDYDIPRSAVAAGFEPIGSAAGPANPPDYTLVWVAPRSPADDPNAEAGSDDDVPSLTINVAARGWAQNASALDDDSSEAEVTKIPGSDGELELTFLYQGCLVRVSGRGVPEQTVRAVATSLRVYSRQEWRARVGDRLTVDETP
jgi:hypothetical protein